MNIYLYFYLLLTFKDIHLVLTLKKHSLLNILLNLVNKTDILWTESNYIVIYLRIIFLRDKNKRRVNEHFIGTAKKILHSQVGTYSIFTKY